MPIIQEFEQGVCLELSKWAHKISERDIIESARINYVKTQRDRLLNRIDRAVRISIKFRQVANFFKRLSIFQLGEAARALKWRLVKFVLNR